MLIVLFSFVNPPVHEREYTATYFDCQTFFYFIDNFINYMKERRYYIFFIWEMENESVKEKENLKMVR